MENNLLLVDNNLVDEINKYLPRQCIINKLADHFHIFSDSTRLKIISCLSISKMCVNDLSKVLNINQTTISHQLKILKSQRIVVSNRIGKLILYNLSDNVINDTMLVGVNFVSTYIS